VPLTDAERQRRRRRRLRKEKRDGEILAKREANQAKYHRRPAERYTMNVEHGFVSPQPPRTLAEELVRQIADVILLGDVTPDEIRAAFNAIFPKRDDEPWPPRGP
jgi:hypothetical protein